MQLCLFFMDLWYKPPIISVFGYTKKKIKTEEEV